VLIESARVRDALIQALADEYSRKIILETIGQPKSISELSEKGGIPLSTAYRRVTELKDAGILVVEKIILTSEGKKFELYRSAFRSVEIKLDQGELTTDAVLNEDIAARFSRIWSSLRG
jgi:DNA-binding Lrp family transcriptional regulator